jgi:hypothetical protein
MKVFFFWTNTEHFLLINSDQDPLKFFNFFVKNAYLTPLKKSSNLHKYQELSGPFTHASIQKKGKILQIPLSQGGVNEAKKRLLFTF